MPNTTNWLRWGTSKWHLRSDNNANIEGVCGSGPIWPGEVEYTEQPIVPEDEHNVCLHCIRWREKKLREG